MTDADATRLAGGNSDATRFAGESYRTRLASSAAVSDDKTRIAQEGYQSKLARDAANVQADAIEFYKLGDKIGGRYEVSAIHHGAMGVVYGCFDHQTKLPRALKTVRSRHLHDKQVLSLFESEAAVWIALEKHPYIVRAYLVERFNKLPYVITEYVRGPEGMEGDLRGWLGHPRLTLPVAVAMALQIAQGMQHAVRKVPNLVHRDLKPANILVSGDGKAMVTDFGLVNSAESGAGTPAYMSPEQWREDALDARSDIYAYGCILFEMFTSHRLFPALTERDWERAHLEYAPTALTSLVPELPGEIDQYVRRCLEKDVMVRPQSWDEVVAFFSEWYHCLTGKSVVLDFSSLAFDAAELVIAGYSLSNLKQYEAALLVYDRAHAIDPSDSNVLLRKGHAYESLNLYEKALQAYEQAIEINPKDAEFWVLKANILYDLKRYEETIYVCDEAIAIDTTDNFFEWAWLLKGKALYGLKRYEDAVLAYEQVFDDFNPDDPECSPGWFDDPDDAFALLFKGEMFYKLDRFEDAIRAYDQVLEIDPINSYAWSNKGSALCCLERYEEALQAYDQVLSIDPNDGDAWENKCTTLMDINRYEEAVQSLSHALTIFPNSYIFWFWKGFALSEIGRLDEAVLAYDQAILIEPSDTGAFINKGNALFKLNRYNEAVLVYNQAIEIDPDDEWKKLAMDAFNAAHGYKK